MHRTNVGKDLGQAQTAAQQVGLQARANDMRSRAIQFRQQEGPRWASAIERSGTIPDALWLRMRELGLHKLTQPAWVGGEGLPLTLYFPILEEMAHCHGSIRMVFHAYNSIWCTVGQGTHHQQQRWLSRLVNDGALVAFALTEPDNGTGIDLRTTATWAGDRYLLNGRKHLITFAEEAAVFTVIAKMEGAAGRAGLTAFLVPQGRSGMTLEPMHGMMGDRGCSHAVITFADCPVFADEVLGDVGAGFDVALRGFLDQSRAGIAQSAVGLAQEALDLALRHVLQRTAGGRSAASRQAVQMRLADMQIAIQGARLLCFDAAQRYDAGEDIAVPAAVAKANAIRMVGEVTDAALSLFEFAGCAVDSPMERLYRDARSLWFEEGSIEMQKMTIAEALLADARRLAKSVTRPQGQTRTTCCR